MKGAEITRAPEGRRSYRRPRVGRCVTACAAFLAASCDAGLLEVKPRDWLVTATPGAGKTTYALATARQLWDAG